MGGFLPSFSVSVFPTTRFDGWDSLKVFPTGVDPSVGMLERAGAALILELTSVTRTYSRCLDIFNIRLQNRTNAYLDVDVDVEWVQSSYGSYGYMVGTRRNWSSSLTFVTELTCSFLMESKWTKGSFVTSDRVPRNLVAGNSVIHCNVRTKENETIVLSVKNKEHA